MCSNVSSGNVNAGSIFPFRAGFLPDPCLERAAFGRAGAILAIVQTIKSTW